MKYVLPVLPSTHIALQVALRLLPEDAEVVLASHHEELPDWLALTKVTVYPSTAHTPSNMAKAHRVRAYLHAAVTQMVKLGHDNFVYVAPGSAARCSTALPILSEIRYGSRLSAHPYTYEAELARTAFMLEHEGFVPRLYATGAPFQMDAALADITLSRYGYRTHFESMYLRGHEPASQMKTFSSGPVVAPWALSHIFNAEDAEVLRCTLPHSRFEL